jgi:hypothetical protein
MRRPGRPLPSPPHVSVGGGHTQCCGFAPPRPSLPEVSRPPSRVRGCFAMPRGGGCVLASLGPALDRNARRLWSRAPKKQKEAGMVRVQPLGRDGAAGDPRGQVAKPILHPRSLGRRGTVVVAPPLPGRRHAEPFRVRFLGGRHCGPRYLSPGVAVVRRHRSPSGPTPRQYPWRSPTQGSLNPGSGRCGRARPGARWDLSHGLGARARPPFVQAPRVRRRRHFARLRPRSGV